MNLAIVTADVSARSIRDIKVAPVADNQTVYDVRVRISPTDYTATAVGYFTIDDDLCQTVLDDGTVSTSTSNTTMSAIATRNCADNLNISPAVTDGTPNTSSDTSCELRGRVNRTLNLQVLDNSAPTDIAEDGSVVFLRIHVDFDGVALSIESSMIGFAVVIFAYHCRIQAQVNVGCQLGTGCELTTIHECSKLLPVSCRTNLIYIPDFVECIRRHADNHHDGCQTYGK